MRNFMTDETFNNTKALLNLKMPRRQIAEILNVSMSTVNRIALCDSLQAYKDAQRKPEPKKPEPAPQVVRTEAPQVKPSDYQMNRLIELVKQQNELLTGISAKLAYIVEQLS